MYHSTGHCVTAATPGDMCDLSSYAVGCDIDGLSATACRCYQDDTNMAQNITSQNSTQTPENQNNNTSLNNPSLNDTDQTDINQNDTSFNSTDTDDSTSESSDINNDLVDMTQNDTALNVTSRNDTITHMPTFQDNSTCRGQIIALITASLQNSIRVLYHGISSKPLCNVCADMIRVLFREIVIGGREYESCGDIRSYASPGQIAKKLIKLMPLIRGV